MKATVALLLPFGLAVDGVAVEPYRALRRRASYLQSSTTQGTTTVAKRDLANSVIETHGSIENLERQEQLLREEAERARSERQELEDREGDLKEKLEDLELTRGDETAWKKMKEKMQAIRDEKDGLQERCRALKQKERDLRSEADALKRQIEAIKSGKLNKNQMGQMDKVEETIGVPSTSFDGAINVDFDTAVTLAEKAIEELEVAFDTLISEP